jgi:methionyl-tRNA synthetase
VERAARERGERPIELADRMVDRFKALWGRLEISNDDFIRTTEDRHKRATQLFFQQIYERGDIYKGTYEGWYCTPCETFIPETQMEEGNTCPDCGRPTERLKEESYFFRMSKYQSALLNHIEKHPDFIQPVTRRNEIVSFVERGLKDLSISRTSFSWGIPVPGDPKHVMYVWVDALANYITAAGYGQDPERFARYWPANLHLIGKDILRFHAVYWPTLLMAANLQVPEKVFGHGWWTVEGRKMSKSVRNVVEPNRLMDEFGVDAFRYFLLREVPFGLDGDFSRAALIGRINGDLANDLGNLFSRVLAMVDRYQRGTLAGPKEPSGPLSSGAKEMTEEVRGLMEGLAFHRALGRIWDFIGEMNRFVDEKAPWVLARDKERKGELEGVLNALGEGLRIVALQLAAFMPGTARAMWSQLGLSGKPEESVGEDLWRWGIQQGAREIRKGGALFPRIEKEVVSVGGETPASVGEKSGPAGSAKEGGPKISIDEFARLDLRVAKVLSADSITGSKKLIKLEVDLGGERRTLLAGIAQTHKPQDLVGKKVIVVANLQPAKLMGIESQGMVLAAVADEKNIVLVVPEGDIPPGTRVK